MSKFIQSTTAGDDYYEEVIEDEEEYIEEIILEGSDVDKYDLDDDASDYTEVTLEDEDDKSSNGINAGVKKLALVTKTAAQKAAEKELAENLALSESAHERREEVMSRQKQLAEQQNHAKEQLAREDTERIRRVEEEAKRSEMSLGGEYQEPRQEDHTSTRRSSVIKAQAAAEEAMRAQREALEAIQRQSEDERTKLAEEAQLLQVRIEEARKAAHVAKLKEEEEKARLKAKVNARREAAKQMLAKANSELKSKADAPPSMFQAANRKLKERDPEKERKEAAAILDGVTEFYSIEQLKKQSIHGLDYKNREKYLSDADFHAAFKCTKTEWAEMPGWKKTKAKRALGLF